MRVRLRFFFFFFNDTATTEIYTLSLHDALPISAQPREPRGCQSHACASTLSMHEIDRKSTRLNSSHGYISYAVFCLKKKTLIVRDTVRNVSLFATPPSSECSMNCPSHHASRPSH